MNKETFIKLMTNYKELDIDINNVNIAMRKLDPDFGGFCISRVATAILEVLQAALDDKGDWISYYIYDLEWGTKYKKGCIKEKDGKNIPLKTLGDLYNLLTENLELK